MPAQSSFLQFWSTHRIRNNLLAYVSTEDLGSLRLVCHDFDVKTAPFLFQEIKVTFRSTTFARQSRMAALERVGHLIKTFHFSMPHSNETFLAPLIDSITGESVAFIYEPQQVVKDLTKRLSIPSYGSWEMTDLLVKQYPPLFHAAANVNSFIQAFSKLKSLAHLKISCPNQDASQRYRRSIVDYALISLRIAIERNRLLSLNSLSLLDVHPAALLYLNPSMGFGTSPSSLRRWKQIRRLTVHMASISPKASSQPDHFKHLNAYISLFSSFLRQIDFRWLGDRCTCPMTLNVEPSMKAPSPPNACPSTCSSPRKQLHFSRLRTLAVGNTIADASQIARFINCHRRRIRHTKRLSLKFDDTTLRTGTWDEALDPLTQMSGTESWKSSSEELVEEAVEEFMDVPIMFSPVDEKQDPLDRAWDDRVRSRASRPCHSGMSGLQKAGARTRELLFGTEEHMRKLFSSTVLGWR